MADDRELLIEAVDLIASGSLVPKRDGRTAAWLNRVAEHLGVAERVRQTDWGMSIDRLPSEVQVSTTERCDA